MGGQEQTIKRIAELLRERRRSRRTMVEYSPKGSHPTNGVVETLTITWKDFYVPSAVHCWKTCVSVNVALGGETLCVVFDEVRD